MLMNAGKEDEVKSKRFATIPRDNTRFSPAILPFTPLFTHSRKAV